MACPTAANLPFSAAIPRVIGPTLAFGVIGGTCCSAFRVARSAVIFRRTSVVLAWTFMDSRRAISSWSRLISSVTLWICLSSTLGWTLVLPILAIDFDAASASFSTGFRLAASLRNPETADDVSALTAKISGDVAISGHRPDHRVNDPLPDPGHRPPHCRRQGVAAGVVR